MKVIRVLDFSEFPGPRHEHIGPFSGQRFREEVLLPAIKEHGINNISIDLDGTAGYGSSFLEEAFGGLIRAGVPYSDIISLSDRIISAEDPSLISEVRSYIKEEGLKHAS